MKTAGGAKAKAKGGAKAKAKAGDKGAKGKDGKPNPEDDDFDERAADIDAICEKYPRCSREKAGELHDNFFNDIFMRGQDHYFSDSDMTDIITEDEVSSRCHIACGHILYVYGKYVYVLTLPVL